MIAIMLLAINYTKIFTSIELLDKYKQDRNGGRLDTGTPVQNDVEKDVGTPAEGQAALGEDQMALEENQEDHHVHHQDENPDQKTLLSVALQPFQGSCLNIILYDFRNTSNLRRINESK